MKPSYFLTIMMVAAIYWMGILYQSFLLNMTIAVLLVMATRHIYQFAFTYTKRDIWASVVSTLIVALLLFVPMIYFITTVAIQVAGMDMQIFVTLAERTQVWIATELPDSLGFIKPYLLDFFASDSITHLASKAVDVVAKVGAKSAGFLMDSFLIMVFYFFALFYGRVLGAFFLEIIPLHPGQAQNLYDGITNVMSVVFYSILVTAIFEGALFAVMVVFFDYNPVLFGILYGFASLIPVVGAALMWIPLSAYEFSLGHAGAALFIAVYTIVVISIIADTFIKPIIIKYVNVSLLKTKVLVNELIIFFAILAGLSTFGFWGMIIGPAITTFFISLLKLYREMKQKQQKPTTVAMS